LSSEARSAPHQNTADIPVTMRAIRLRSPGGPEELVVEDVATPGRGPGEAMVRVHAAAITRGELEWPVDRLPAIPSYELSGVVTEIAADVDAALTGQSVYALTPFDRDGAAAEFVAVPATMLAPKPRSLDHVHAAAVPLAALSAWQGLFDHGELQASQRVLIHGATGGVGQFATQLARWRGAHVIGTTSRTNAERARELGAHQVIEYDGIQIGGALAPVDLVFDTAGGDILARSPAIVRPGGKVVSVAEEPPPQLADSNITCSYFVVKPNKEQLIEIGRLVDSGDLRAEVDSVFRLEEAREAFARTMARAKHGKVVLEVVHD
jgi:NADPH:quinone reductase-like Zn-dependent oxidoreductase